MHQEQSRINLPQYQYLKRKFSRMRVIVISMVIELVKGHNLIFVIFSIRGSRCSRGCGSSCQKTTFSSKIPRRASNVCLKVTMCSYSSPHGMSSITNGTADLCKLAVCWTLKDTALAFNRVGLLSQDSAGILSIYLYSVFISVSSFWHPRYYFLLTRKILMFTNPGDTF